MRESPLSVDLPARVLLYVPSSRLSHETETNAQTHSLPFESSVCVCVSGTEIILYILYMEKIHGWKSIS